MVRHEPQHDFEQHQTTGSINVAYSYRVKHRLLMTPILRLGMHLSMSIVVVLIEVQLNLKFMLGFVPYPDLARAQRG